MIHPALFPRYLLLWPLCLLLVQCSSEPDNVTTSEDGAQMLLIESGEFPMGGRPEDVEGLEVKNYINYVSEGPVHQVKISGFYLDKFERQGQAPPGELERTLQDFLDNQRI